MVTKRPNYHKKINKDFVFDIVKALRQIYKSREESADFLGAYSMKEDIENAKDVMTKWENDKDVVRGKVAKDMLSAIADLRIASDTYLTLMDKPNAKDIALFQVKLGEGRGKLIPIAVNLVIPKGEGIKLSNSQKQEIVEYIDETFEKEIRIFKEEGQDKDFSQPQEIWTLIMLRNGLSI